MIIIYCEVSFHPENARMRQPNDNCIILSWSSRLEVPHIEFLQDSCLFVSEAMIISRIRSDIYKRDFILFLLLHRNSFSTQRPYELDESCAMFGNAHFDTLRKTVLYIHGHSEGSNHESVRVVVDAYLQRNDHNVLVLDWTELASGNYLIDSVPNAKQVKYNVRRLRDWLLQHNEFYF